MSPHATPFLRLLLPFASGIAFGGAIDRPIPGFGYGVALGGLLALLLAWQSIAYRYRWFFGAYIALYLFAVGYFHAIQHCELRRADHFAHRRDSCRILLGAVSESPGKGARLKVVLRVEAAGPSFDRMAPARGSLLLFLKPDSLSNQIRYGDHLRVAAVVRPVDPPKNPYMFDYGRYLHFQNIHFQAFPKPDSLQIAATGGGAWWWKLAYICRDRLLDLLHRHFPAPDEYAVASALLLGYKEDLSDELRAAYIATGSMHALAVSGSHVSMLYAGLWFFLGRLPLRGRAGRFLPALLALLGIWAFTFLTGATASVLRASVMFTIYLLGKAAWRENNAWNALAASAFLLLVVNPYYLFDAGFQLSYTAVAGMVFFYPRFYKRAPVWPSRAANWLLQAFIVGCAAQLGTLPLSLYYFHQFPVYFWIAGWVVLFIGGAFMVGGTALLLLDTFWPTGAEGLAWALHQLLWALNRLIVFIQHLPGSVIEGIWVTGWAAALLYVAILFAGAALAYPKRYWRLLTLGLLAVLGGCRLAQTLAQTRQRKIIVYHTPKHTLVDCFNGIECLTAADSIPAKRENAAAQANRWASGVFASSRILRLDSLPPALKTQAPKPKTQPLHLDSLATAGDGEDRGIGPPILRFYGYTLALPGPHTWSDPTEGTPPVPVDLLLLRGNPRVDLAECRRRFPCPLIVFDASNTRWSIAQWRKTCEAEGWRCWDVTEKGALVLDLNDLKSFDADH